jgi:hypothetical protein
MHAPDDVAFETTLHVRDNCLCLHAQRVARALSRRFDGALKPAGITSGQFSLLMSLNRPEPPNVSSVAALRPIAAVDASRPGRSGRGGADLAASPCRD